MSTPIKCDHCNKKADAKIGDVPEYLCAECWLKFHGKKEQKT